MPLASGFENRDAPVVGVTGWENGEIVQMLHALGLPGDSSLSLLCVEMMPTMSSLTGRQGGARLAANDPAAQSFAERSGAAGSAAVADTPLRPLSQGLGHFRILRTSPLTQVPDVCGKEG